MLFKALAVAAAVGGAVAQRPNGTSICDYYTTALLKNNTAANQMTILTLVVNTAVIGNYTTPNVGVMVPGILAPGKVNDTAVNLLPYFNGDLASTNGGGMMGISMNFLDGGGAEALKMNMPAFANATSSNQYTLMTHLYEYFGTLLGCSMQGGADYPAYSGSNSQYNVHKFMDLNYAQVTYFITQVALSAASFGVAEEDIAVVGKALGGLFNVRCGPSEVVIPSQPAELQSICVTDDCPVAMNASCAAYANVSMPMSATPSSSMMATGTGAGSPSMTSGGSPSMTSGSPSGTGSAPATVSKAAGAVYGVSSFALFGGLAALFL